MFARDLTDLLYREHPRVMRGNEPGPTGDDDQRSPDDAFADVIATIRKQIGE